MPYRSLCRSYKANGKSIYPIYSEKIIKSGNIKYAGWYAIKENTAGEFSTKKKYYKIKKVMKVFNGNGQEMHTITTGITRYCKNLNLPSTQLLVSAKEGGTPIFTNLSNSGITKLKNNGRYKYVDWYAIYIDMQVEV